MNLYQIDISGGFAKDGYSGTVEVSEGIIKVEFPTATMTNKLKRYHLHLLTPDKKNIELNILRFPDGEWCDYRYFQLGIAELTSELRVAVKKEIIKMQI